MAKISTWSTTAASNNAASPDGYPEGMLPSGVNNSARETMAAVRSQWEDAEWFDWGDTVTFVSTSSFNIAGDVTARYITDRAIRCYGPTMGTVDTYVVSSSYSSPNTTVTVVSTGLLGDLSQVYLGIISNSTALPKGLDLQIDSINGGTTDENTTVGIGIDTPDGVGAGYSALQVGNSGYMYSTQGSTAGNAFFGINNNVNYADGVTFEYIETDFASQILLGGTGQINMRTAPSGTAGTTATLTNRFIIYNDGGVVSGSSASQGAGTHSAENGLYHGANRNNRIVMLTTPLLITSAPTTGAWTTYNAGTPHDTLTAASATAAIVQCYVIADSGSAATTDQALGAIFLRETGSALANNPLTNKVYATAYCSVVGEATQDIATNDAFISLDSNFEFDYYATDSTSGGGANTFYMHLIGYIQDC